MVNTLLLLDIDGAVMPMRHPKVLPAVDQVTFAVAVPPRLHASVPIRPAVIEAIKQCAASGIDIQRLTSCGWRTKWLDHIGPLRLPILYTRSRAKSTGGAAPGCLGRAPSWRIS